MAFFYFAALKRLKTASDTKDMKITTAANERENDKYLLIVAEAEMFFGANFCRKY